MTRFLSQTACRRPSVPHWMLLGVCAWALAGCGKVPAPATATRAATASGQKAGASGDTNIIATLAKIETSSFSTNITDGRDPFFPDSTRRAPKLVQAPKGQPAKPVHVPANFLKLTGLWPSKNRPLAMINRIPLGPGEEANITITVPSQQNKPESFKLLVRCLEVRKNSVLISIDGEPGTKELVLPARL